MSEFFEAVFEFVVGCWIVGSVVILLVTRSAKGDEVIKDQAYEVVVACKHVEEGSCIECVRKAITAARAEGRAAGYVEGRQAAIEATRKWATNYPADIFPEPVGDAPPQSDRWHASWARHTCKQIEREILEFAPAATTEGPK